MPDNLLQTKFHVPRLRPFLVPRPHLIEALNQGLAGKLTLISAPAGFGKTTLVSTWIDTLQTGSDTLLSNNLSPTPTQIAWLSLDGNDHVPARFLSYVIAALQRVDPHIGVSARSMLQASPLPVPTLLTALLNDIAARPDPLVLVLDDYHVVDVQPIGEALAFLLDHLPPQLHLVITTREDPDLPLARLRVRGQLTEVRASDLRFDVTEAAVFLRQTMGLDLSEDNIAALEARTEGWVAGLQLASISLQGHQKDTADFIDAFTGSHRFVLDYLVEEVLHQQSESVQRFLLQTSILDRLCGPLCDAVSLSIDGQATLEALERANLFLIPLDNERRWYRYHHLFVEFLRQRLQQQDPNNIAEHEIRASEWYEDNGYEIEAFQHAVAANDVQRAERLVEGEGTPMHFRGAGAYVLNWLASLSTTELDARPSLWVIYASTLLFVGQHLAVEQKLQAAEAALKESGSDDKTTDLVGRIAALRATLAVIQNDVETIIAESLRAQQNLHPDNLIYRTIATWALGVAYQFQGDRAAASRAFTETISIGGDSIYVIAATINLGNIQETDNQLTLATKTYKNSLHLAGDPPQPIACEGFLGLARIHYEWNDLAAAEQYGQQCFQMTQQMDNVDSFVSYGVFLSRLMLARGDVPGAVTVLDEVEEFVHHNNFEFRMPNVADAQVLALLREGSVEKAAQLAEMHDLPFSQARVHLAEGDSATALAILERLRQQAKDQPDERLKVAVLQAIAYQANGELDKALLALGDALMLAEPDGFIRVFLDEGTGMAQLLSDAMAQGMMPGYVSKLLAVFEAEKQEPDLPLPQALIDPLSERELEVLALVAAGLKNKEIAEQLFISLNTVLYHIKNIYDKLGVRKRTLAIIKARELDLLPEE